MSDPRANRGLNELRDDFVDAFNQRDLDGIVDLVRSDVQVPEAPEVEGPDAVVDELQVMWQRTPQIIATSGLLDGSPAAVLWVPRDELRRGSRHVPRWMRSVVVVLSSVEGLLVLVDLVDDPDTLERAGTPDPTGDELAEWDDWREWNAGDEVAREDRA